MSFGPFEVDPAQIDRLTSDFAPFVNRLLEAEVAASEIRGYSLTITQNETTPDGGVDAALRTGAEGSDWLPDGASAWQFKRSNPGPTACANEFAGAGWAHEIVKDRGSYVLVIRHALNDSLIAARRKKIADKAVELGLIEEDERDRIRVYDSNALARWASQFPSLAVSRVLGGPGSVASDFRYWSESRSHQSVWTADDRRQEAVSAIRAQATSSGVVELRVQGESGIGKTRLVLEALRDESLQSLVAYVADERQVDGDLIAHLVGERRIAVLVVDDCLPERHIKLAERLPADPGVKLVTIGPAGSVGGRAPVIVVDALPEAETGVFLTANYPHLSPEARRFITDHTRGNTRWTIVFAERLTGSQAAQAADLIERNDIEAFVTTLLPEGRQLFLTAVLALLERVGWDRELRPQLETVAAFAGATVQELEDVARDLERRELLIKQGRYRAVAPHPLAVYLAAEVWRTESSRIVTELLPVLSEEMALGLFQRVADLGRFEPARSVLPRLLARDGPFGSLDALEHEPSGKLLTQLAIVLPDEVARHLSGLLEAASLDDLRARTAARRDLVWTLEKLVWHRRTFETAANSLLRLALAENETWANNATGTWIDLFGTLLPGTAATPAERLAYLEGVAESRDAADRHLAIRATARILTSVHESISVSGEVQGGVLVEPRGSANTWDEVRDYRQGAIALLRRLTADVDASVADAASEQLIAAVHPLIDDPLAGDSLFEALLALNEPWRIQLRRELEHLISLHESHSGPDRELLLQRLHELSAALPEPTTQERLAVLFQLRRWDFRDDELKRRLVDAMGALEPADRRWVMRTVRSEQLPAAWEVGNALAHTSEPGSETERTLVESFTTNPEALLGYLQGLVERGDQDAFEEFLDGPVSSALDAQMRLAIAARGPQTSLTRSRILGGAKEIPVAQAARALFGWQGALSEAEVAEIAEDWLQRLDSQEDYNALLDWFPVPHRQGEALPSELVNAARELVFRRLDFPELRQQQWEWSQLALRLVPDSPAELARLIMDLIDGDHLMIHRDDPESQVLLEAMKERPAEVWEDLSRRLTGGSWRLQMEVRGWLIYGATIEVLADWIGDDVERARIVAAVAPTGASAPSEIARFLLDRFPDDQEIGSSLWGNFISGVYSGPESARLEQQIEQVRGWQTQDASEGVRRWSAEMVEHFQQRLEQVLEREAEGGY